MTTEALFAKQRIEVPIIFVAAKWGDWKSEKKFEPRTDVEINLAVAKVRPRIHILSSKH